MERVKGIEPSSVAWEATALPLSYTRVRYHSCMKIQLNGEPREFDAPLSVHGLLQAAGYGERRVAVEVNREIVARSRHATHALREGDQVEIIQAIGGG
jgi:sulfur carrier protein